MSMLLMVQAMAIKVGNPLRKLVLIKLADNASDSGECWPSVGHIAEQCEISPRSVQSHIRQLVKDGLVRVEQRRGSSGVNQSNVYHLNLAGEGANPAPYGAAAAPRGRKSCGGEGAGAAPRTSQLEPVIEPIDSPNPQEGEEGAILADAQKALEFYNQQTGTRCRDAKPFVTLLTPTTSRDAYTVDDLQLVIRWVVSEWKRRGDTYAKPANICRVNRFDGYLADATAWATAEAAIPAEEVIAGYNEILGDVLPVAELDDDRRRMIRHLQAHMLTQSLGAFLGYFEKFRDTAPEFYFGGPERDGWRASFDYLMKPETLRKTREDAL